jgi:hypothetical protein
MTLNAYNIHVHMYTVRQRKVWIYVALIVVASSCLIRDLYRVSRRCVQAGAALCPKETPSNRVQRFSDLFFVPYIKTSSFLHSTYWFAAQSYQVVFAPNRGPKKPRQSDVVDSIPRAMFICVEREKQLLMVYIQSGSRYPNQL